MHGLQIELTKLIGSKELTFGCLIEISSCIDGCCGIETHIVGNDVWLSGDRKMIYWNPSPKYSGEGMYVQEIIGHPATLSDFHKWLESKGVYWRQKSGNVIQARIGGGFVIKYNSSKDFLDQTPEILARIIELISNNP